MTRWLVLVFAAFALVAALAEAQTEKRRALLIGLQNYDATVGPLQNPHKDVDLLADVLSDIGFEVTVVKDEADPDRPMAAVDLKSRVIQHAEAMAADLAADPTARGVSFVYYSGHGAANAAVGKDFLIPQDAIPGGDRDFWASSLAVEDVLDTLEVHAGSANHLVVFDACRNELRLSDGTRNLSKGFSALPTKGGMLVSYTTASGALASDGEANDPAGPYATILAEELRVGGKRVTPMFVDVGTRMRDTYSQRPIMTVDLQDAIYLNGGDGTLIERPAFDPDAAPTGEGGVTEVSGAVEEEGAPEEVLKALVISNETYNAPLPALDTSHAQADEMAAALQVTGFDVVQLRDPSRASLISEFSSLYDGFDNDAFNKLAVVYYFGHARALDGGGPNYLIPAGAPVRSAVDLRIHGVELGKLIDRSDRPDDVDTIVFVDWCSDAGLGGVGDSACAPEPDRENVLLTFTASSTEEDAGEAPPPGEGTPSYSAVLSSEIIKGGSVSEAIERTRIEQSTRTDIPQGIAVSGALGKDYSLRTARDEELEQVKQAPIQQTASKFAPPGQATLDPNIFEQITVAKPDLQACVNAVQDKIAWNAAGTSKRWSSANVNDLCEGAAASTAPAQCFRAFMAAGRRTDGDWRADWKTGVALCKGAASKADYDTRLACLKRSGSAAEDRTVAAARTCAAQ